MNERIRELADEAKLNTVKYANEHNPKISDQDWADVYDEKFARLIVRECAKSANDWYQNHDKIHSDPMSYVLAHFGVEE